MDRHSINLFYIGELMTEISLSKTKAGIPVITDHIPDCLSAGYMVTVRTGSRDEDKDVLGISHLLEHVVFRSTKTRSSYQIAKEMEGAGGMMNAFTAKEATGYFGLTIGETADIARELVSDIVANPLIGDEDTEMEKKIVLQELSMIKNDPGSYIYDLIDELVWEGHDLGQGEGGKEDIVEGLDYEDLREYYYDRYGAPNIAVFAVGDVDEKTSVEWASDIFDDMEAKTAPSRTGPPMPKSNYKFVSNSADHYQVALALPTVGPTDSDSRYAMTMLSAVLGSGTSSRLFQEVREKNALVYSVHSAWSRSTDAAYMGMFMSSTAENVTKSIDATSKVIRTFLDEGLGKGELERSKRLIKGEMVRSQESTARRMTSVAREFMLTGKLFSLYDVLSKIDAVTGEEVMKAAEQILTSDSLNTVILGNEDKAIKDMEINMDF
ncbi:MAG TPA: pitrilysin family protein [Candidatus Methanomethylophilaceae archaeon]|nr:pitrilysin family protein [Candidatus Methanomethylophilaceae archaeon]